MGGKSSSPPDMSGIQRDIQANRKVAMGAAQTGVDQTNAANAANAGYVRNVQDTGTNSAAAQSAAANQAFGQGATAAGDYAGAGRSAMAQTAMDAYGGQYLNADQRGQLTDAAKNGDGATVSRLTNDATTGAANQAMGTANASSQNAMAEMERNMSRAGGDPNKMAAYSAQMQAAQAANATGAANTARINATNQGIALRTGVANAYQGVAGLANQSNATGGNLASAATGNTVAAATAAMPGLQASQNANAGVINAANGTSQATLGLAGLQQQAYNTQQQQANAEAAGTGQAAGAAAMAAAYAFSDRRLKTDIERIGTHKLGIGVYRWRYVDVPPDDMDIEHYHFAEWGEIAEGVMADEVRDVMPDAIIRIGSYDAVDYEMLGA